MNVQHPPTGLELVCRVGWRYSIGYWKSDVESGLDYNGPGLIIGVHFIFRDLMTFSKSSTTMTFDESKEIFTCMELGRPLKGWASVKNSVLWSSRP